MKYASHVFALLAVFTICLPLGGVQSRKDTGSSLLIYGKGFSFNVREPRGWTADTAERARQYRVNAIFFPQAQSSRDSGVTIRIRVNRKVDENTEADLKADMDGYKKRYSNVQFEGLAIRHEQYKVFSKLFFVPDKFYEYVVYVNPGADVPMVFSFALSKQGTRASADELAAFAEVVQSFTFLAQSVVGK